jgi:hypothetical protein
MEINNPITISSIFDRFTTNFVQFANANIVYGTGANHFADQPSTITTRYGGTTSGITQSAFSPTNPISASEIRSYISAQVVIYSRIRDVRVTRNVTATGTNPNGTVVQPTSSSVQGITNMSSGDAGTGYVTPSSSSNIQAGKTIEASSLSSFMTDSKNNYVSGPRSSLLNMSFSVCHNSCHSNCHNNRGRR